MGPRREKWSGRLARKIGGIFELVTRVQDEDHVDEYGQRQRNHHRHLFAMYTQQKAAAPISRRQKTNTTGKIETDVMRSVSICPRNRLIEY